MSIDELSYAGGNSSTRLTAPYVWYYTNANGESSYGSLTFGSLSLVRWEGSYTLVWGIDGSDSPGFLNGIHTGGLHAVRPSVSLLSCNLISRGDGSANNPYVIYTGSGVCE